MISIWRRRSSSRGYPREHNKVQKQAGDLELAIPTHFLCPLSLQLMNDPVILSSGITYDRDSIEKWLQNGNFTCPVTTQILRSFDQVPNHAIRKLIQDWCVDNHVERIPTPKIPVTPSQVSEILSTITASTLQGDQNQCLEMMHILEKWSAESERNRQCIITNGTASVLAATFDAFASFSSSNFEENAILLEQILSTIDWMFPLDVEAQKYLGSPASLLCIVWFLNTTGDVFKTQIAILALKELLSIDQQYSEALAQIEGVIQLLIKLIKEPICSKVTKAVLSVIFSMVSSSSSAFQSTFLEMGLASSLLEILVDSETEKSICERALGILDRVCDWEEGREKVCSNALTMPVLVKKLLRVSGMATEFAVSTIWKLCRYGKWEERSALMEEALQVGAFQKLLLVLQVGCGDATKEEATELLKLLNPYREGLECIKSADFKNLKTIV